MEIITVPFGWLLNFLYQLTDNYGLSLILFAILVQIVLLPISAKSKKSMMKMTRLQPRINAIKEKYMNGEEAKYVGVTSATKDGAKADKQLVVVHNGTEEMETGIKKFGAMLGDYVEVGCNAVLNPGTVIGRNSNVYPTSCVRGVVPENSIWKNSGEIIEKN